MKQVADDVWLLSPSPAPVNVYVVGDVLVDAGFPWDADRILSALRAHDVTAHAITHAHPDHMGSSHAVCEQLQIPYWVGEGDVAAAEEPGRIADMLPPVPILGLRLERNPFIDGLVRAACGPGHPVDRALGEGDEVAGFEVLEVPGHTAGHIALWRESDRVLVAGDVIWNVEVAGGGPGMVEPFPFVNFDTEALRESTRRIAELRPELVLFGHGPPLRDPDRLAEFAGVA